MMFVDELTASGKAEARDQRESIGVTHKEEL